MGCWISSWSGASHQTERPKTFRERSRRIAPADIEDVRRHIKELLAAGIITESRSPYASPIVVARKKSGAIRMCIDYRTLNARTIPDQYTTPRIDDALDSLVGSKWFSVLDLRSGYYQIAMAEEDKEKTAFICPLGFFQFERMPQGITGAPATFQRLMEKAVGDMHLLQVIVYLDDIIVFGRTLEEHEERLLKVLDRLGECGLKVSIDKCQFCQPQVRYVGHIVSAAGVSPDPAKVEAVTRWKSPTDLKTLRSFLGFCGFYRRFIKDYSAIVRPLTELTKGYPPTSGQNSKSSDGKIYFRISDPFGERWDDTCTAAFQNIIDCLTHAPVLAFADPAKPYVLHVDPSLSGLGAVLNQEHSGGLRPVAYASRKLSASEQRYPIHQLEFLALKWAVVDKFHDYLYGAQFVVKTDNNPLTYVLSSAKLSAMGHRWLAAIATYNFSLQYKPGSHNIDADVLSRYPGESTACSEWKELPRSGVRAICQLAVVAESGGSSSRLVDPLGVLPEGIPNAFSCPTALGRSQMEQLSTTELRKAQEEDQVVGAVTGARSSDATIALLQRQGDKLKIKSQLLNRVTKSSCGREKTQLVLPEKYWATVLQSLHDDSGHLGVEKTTELVKDRFYWPRMSAYIEQYVKDCGREARLPVDVCFGTSPDGKGAGSHRQYVEKMKTELQRAYQLATQTAQKCQQRNKRLYDKRVKHQSLAVGDRVLIRNLAVVGKNKLGDKWNSVPYLVVEKLDNLPVYRLKPDSGVGGVRTLHRDHLLPVGDHVRLTDAGEPTRAGASPETRTRSRERKRRRGVGERNVGPTRCELRNSSDSEEDDVGYYYSDRVERQPRPECVTRDDSTVEDEPFDCGWEVDRPFGEMAEPMIMEEGPGEFPDSQVEL
ncbi:hypothetical protein DPEC_G00156160 [Dallia pectoralis]|uniref:Uncharacterized protein n=1 Tax=Dallia pectoralis TaxID=75939 RepID=A0ACC2GKM0_DALPE|nr:hypothetical protein DPEC_G00156160 [Dallia pectoralis]